MAKRVTNAELLLNLKKIESKLDTIDKKVINKKLNKIHEDLIAHEKETCGQNLQAMGFAVMAISVTFIITASQPDSTRNLITGFILFFMAMFLMIFYPIIANFSYKNDGFDLRTPL